MMILQWVQASWINISVGLMNIPFWAYQDSRKFKSNYGEMTASKMFVLFGITRYIIYLFYLIQWFYQLNEGLVEMCAINLSIDHLLNIID